MKQVVIPQKKNEKPKKLKKLLESKGFYMIVAICLIMVGIFGFIATQNSKVNNQIANTDFEPEQVLPENVPASAVEPVVPDDVVASESIIEPVALESTVDPSEQELKFASPVDNGIVSTPFSKDTLIYNKTMEDWRSHLAVDIPGDIGTPVKAASKGVVEQVKQDEMLGSIVIIRHNDNLKTKYCNLQKEILVKEGDNIDIGTVIGGVGNTAACEISDPPHLHFEVISNGQLVDPNELITFSE